MADVPETQILSRVAQITSMFDADGISVRLMNSREGGASLRALQ